MRLRINYEKNYPLNYISMLDLQKLFQRALRRAEVKITYSEGFNPHPKISYSPACAMFMTSKDEYLDVDVSQSFENIDLLNQVMPIGIVIKNIRCIPNDNKSLSKEIAKATYTIDIACNSNNVDVDHINTLINCKENTQELILEKYSKKKILKKVNILGKISNFTISKKEDTIYNMLCTLSLEAENILNPNDLINCMKQNKLIDKDTIDVSIMKIKTIFKGEDDVHNH